MNVVTIVPVDKFMKLLYIGYEKKGYRTLRSNIKFVPEKNKKI